jgi:hemoglobin-like flavoprotein
VQEEHYTTFREALMWTLEHGLGDAFTADVRYAWAAVYDLLADTMKDAARAESILPRSAAATARLDDGVN